ncbi:hypothetical protein AK812_SmicGene19610 [Symbiodinium microadriaticum]|uniref:Uncharacterized protein n=2 Tax=Symbiodinium TaxID=2949 RepID=A0A1Q9DS38_SYMMI|nr:hypothetical protein AK812_SmicGene19610 [Symbiodinium microadriaticum]
MAATGEGEWLIKLERGWSVWMVGEQQFHGSTDESFRYNFGKTEFQVDFQSGSEGTSTNLSTGKVRQICFVPRGQSPPSMEREPESSVQPQVKEASDRPVQATKADSNLPTCYYLAAGTSSQSYDGEYHWLIELEKGWSPWMPGNEPFDGNTDQPLRYTLGRYDFEVHFEDETHGTQTNLTTGKVRRIQCLRKGEPVPTWEGTGIRRRPANGAGAELAAAPAESAAMAAQSDRLGRRAPAACPSATTGAPVKGTQKFSLRTSKPAAATRPQVSEAAHNASVPLRGPSSTPAMTTGGTMPRFMRPLKSKHVTCLAEEVPGLGEKGEGDDVKACANFIERVNAAVLEALPAEQLVKLAEACAKSKAVAETILPTVAKACAGAVPSWSMDDVSKLLFALAKVKTGGDLPEISELYGRAAEVASTNLASLSETQLIKVVLALGRIPACKEFVATAAEQVVQKMTTIAAPQLLLLTQGLASLGADNASLTKLVEFWATTDGEEIKLKQLSADQVAKLAQVLAPVMPTNEALWKAVGSRLLDQKSSLSDAGKASVLAAFPETEGPTFDDKEKLLQAVKPKSSKDRDRDRDRDDRKDRDDRDRRPYFGSLKHEVTVTVATIAGMIGGGAEAETGETEVEGTAATGVAAEPIVAFQPRVGRCDPQDAGEYLDLRPLPRRQKACRK